VALGLRNSAKEQKHLCSALPLLLFLFLLLLLLPLLLLLVVVVLLLWFPTRKDTVRKTTRKRHGASVRGLQIVLFLDAIVARRRDHARTKQSLEEAESFIVVFSVVCVALAKEQKTFCYFLLPSW